MIPGFGPDCDLCTPDVHYLLCCDNCEKHFDDPCYPGSHVCPYCDNVVEVTSEEHDLWERDVLGIR